LATSAWIKTLDPQELHAAKYSANSVVANVLQYSASAKSLLLSAGLYAAHWRDSEPIARNRQTLFIVTPSMIFPQAYFLSCFGVIIIME
jgi:hypothetical protein